MRNVPSPPLISSVRFVLKLKPKFVLAGFEILSKVVSLYLFMTCAVMGVMLLISLPAYIMEPFFLEAGNFKIRILCLKGQTVDWPQPFSFSISGSSKPHDSTKVQSFLRYKFLLFPNLFRENNIDKKLLLSEILALCVRGKLKWLLISLYAKVLFQCIDSGILSFT